MEKIKIYLCGGMGKFGKDNFNVGNNWRIYCKKYLEEVSDEVIVIVTNPNDYFNFLDEPRRYSSEREIIEFDLRKVRDSDLIIVNFNDVYSLGSMSELAIAYDRRIPAIGLNADNNILHPWQKEMCTRIFTDINEMLEYIREFYMR